MVICVIGFAGCEFDLTTTIKPLSTISVAEGELSDTYYIRNNLLLNGAKLTAVYSDNSTEEVLITEAMVTGFDSSTAGIKTLTVTYEGKTCNKKYTILKLSYDMSNVVFADSTATYNGTPQSIYATNLRWCKCNV